MLINKAFVIPPLAAHKGGQDRQLCAGVGSREMPQREDHPSISPRTNSREMSFPAQPCPPVLAKEGKKLPLFLWGAFGSQHSQGHCSAESYSHK